MYKSSNENNSTEYKLFLNPFPQFFIFSESHRLQTNPFDDR